MWVLLRWPALCCGATPSTWMEARAASLPSTQPLATLQQTNLFTAHVGRRHCLTQGWQCLDRRSPHQAACPAGDPPPSPAVCSLQPPDIMDRPCLLHEDTAQGGAVECCSRTTRPHLHREALSCRQRSAISPSSPLEGSTNQLLVAPFLQVACTDGPRRSGTARHRRPAAHSRGDRQAGGRCTRHCRQAVRPKAAIWRNSLRDT